jgi:phage baseplate assembly protein W
VPQAISKGFKDISLSFLKHPITNDLSVVSNASAIARSVRNLILTSFGERFFAPNLGSRINKSLFELLDYGSASIIQTEIETTIKNFEPRVILYSVVVTPQYDDNGYNVVIAYYIVGQPNSLQNVEFILQGTR